MSKDAGFIPPSLSASELRTLLLEAIENAPGEKNPETYHARFDHLERGLTTDDVIHGIEGSWTFERQPKFNQREWQWKYRLAAKTIDDEDMTIIVAVDTMSRTFEVITRWTDKEAD
jgi:hypothetical protein